MPKSHKIVKKYTLLFVFSHLYYTYCFEAS